MKFRVQFELHGKHCFTLLFYFLRRKAFLFIFEKGISTDMDNTYFLDNYIIFFVP